MNFIGNWFQCFPVYPSLNLSSGSVSVSGSGSGSGFRIPDSSFSIRPPPCTTLLQYQCSGNTHFVSNCIIINYRKVVHAPRTWRTELTAIVNTVLLGRSCSLGLTMALRMIIGALKRAYPRVPVMTTEELQHLMKKTASQSGYRKLVLLVSKRCSLFVYCVYRQTSVRSFQRVQENLSLVIGLRCPCG